MTFNYGNPYRVNLHWVKNISISDAGRVTLHYSTGTDTDPMTYLLPSTWIKWIDNIQCDTKGIVTVTYNTERTTAGTKDRTVFPNPIKWINAISWAEDGTVTVTYNTESTPGSPDQTIFPNAIKWVNDVRVIGDDEDTDKVGELQIQYNYTEGESTPVYETLQRIKYIKNIELLGAGNGNNTGRLKVTYNTKEWNQTLQAYENEFDLTSEKLTLINDMTFSTDQNGDGILTIRYNDNNTKVLNPHIKFLTDVSLDNQTGIFKAIYNDDYGAGGNYISQLYLPKELKVKTRADNQTDQTDPIGYTGDQKLYVTYTGVQQPVAISNPLNYILKAKVTEGDHHLIVLYSDPSKRTSSNENIYHNGEQIDNYANWIDLGSVAFNDSGVLVGLNLTWQEIYGEGVDPSAKEVNEAISYLNTNYPNGLVGEFLKDKIVTVGNDDENKYFFGFNYDYDYSGETPVFKGWYSIGQLAPSDATVSVALKKSNPPSTLPNGSLWFIVEDLCNIQYNLTNVTSSNNIKQIQGGRTFSTTLTPASGQLLSVSVTMGGEDITSSVRNGRIINIGIGAQTYDSVTGDIVITATAAAAE